jgi:arylsulfatase
MLKHPEDIPPELHQTTWCTDRAIDFIEAQQGRPWLMSVNTFDPHPPFDPPQPYMDRFDPDALPGPLFRDSDLAAQAKLAGIDFQSKPRRPEEFDARRVQAAYYAMIELIDDNLGRLFDALERTGQRENTVIIFMSDHGETLGDHGLLQKGCRFYEGLVRVPLIFSWPGHFPQGLVSDALVELTDVAPTLLDLAGVAAPDRMQGRSLLPILSGQVDPHNHREFVRSEFYHTLNPTAQPEMNGSYATMLRDRRYKLVVYHGHDTGELFDLSADPGEFDNLWDDPACTEIKLKLMQQSFDALAFAVDIGPEQTVRF